MEGYLSTVTPVTTTMAQQAITRVRAALAASSDLR
jgi:hypothetical protein